MRMSKQLSTLRQIIDERESETKLMKKRGRDQRVEEWVQLKDGWTIERTNH